VPNFGPPINTDSIYDNDEAFKDWLLNKLINAETACYKADKFKKLNERTRSALIDVLYNELNEKNARVIQSIFSIGSEDSHSESHYSTHSNVSSRILEQHQNFGSNLHLNSAANQIGSTTNLNSNNSSAAFKFSILNTVRKAFKKSDSTKQTVNNNNNNNNNLVNTSSNRNVQHTVSAPVPPTQSPNKNINFVQEINSVDNSETSTPVSRYRSSTFDAGSFKSTLLTRNQLEPSQAQQMFSIKKSNKNERLSKQMDYHLYGKIGSIDSLNNIENYSNLSNLRQQNNIMNQGGSNQPALLPNHNGTKSAYIKPKSLNLNNISLSDLTNGVKFKNNATHFNYERSDSSSPDNIAFMSKNSQRLQDDILRIESKKQHINNISSR
jgi:hypothetical protein